MDPPLRRVPRRLEAEGVYQMAVDAGVGEERESPGHYRAERARLVVENGGLVYRTYFDVARRYLFRAHDEPQHPSGRVPVRAG